MLNFTIPKDQDDRDIKSVLLDMFPRLKMSEVAKLIKHGDIRVNGVRERENEKVFFGDDIEIYIDPDRVTPAPIEVVFEDDNMLVVNKMPGMSCLSDKDDGKPTVYSQCVDYMRKTAQFDSRGLNVPYVCHRLDHNTGGVMLVAKNQYYFEHISKAIKERRVKKFYYAIVVGIPYKAQAELKGFLTKDSENAKVRVSDRPMKDAKPVLCKFRLLGQNAGLSLLEVELITGRTHQIRAQLAYFDLPILGDDKYGDRKANKQWGVNIQALWAYKLAFSSGKGTALEYLNGEEFRSPEILLPDVGLLKRHVGKFKEIPEQVELEKGGLFGFMRNKDSDTLDPKPKVYTKAELDGREKTENARRSIAVVGVSEKQQSSKTQSSSNPRPSYKNRRGTK